MPFSSNYKQTPKNMFKIQDIVELDKLDRNDTVMPLQQVYTWFNDFYDMLWRYDLKHELYLFLEVIENEATYPTGVAVLKVNNEEGAVRAGSYELPVYKYPLKSFTKLEKNESLGYNIMLFINEPKPDINEQEPEEQKKEKEEKEDEEKSEARSTIHPEDTGKPDDSKDAYIPNTLKQHEDNPYKPEELIVLYVDSARYLPENVTISRVSVRIINMAGEIAIEPISAICLLDLSTCQKPYYGIREEFCRKMQKKLDDTSVLLFRIDGVDRNTYKPLVVGYAFFPLFVDGERGTPAQTPNQNASLNSGLYQIPIF
jgi:hypothetical protein